MGGQRGKNRAGRGVDEGQGWMGVSANSLSSPPFEWGGLGVGYTRGRGERVVLHDGLDWTQMHRVRLQLSHRGLYPSSLRMNLCHHQNMEILV
jgi:hypothetical protein